MKKQDRLPIIRKKQEENKLLEEETKKMEQRLQMLKNVLYKDVPQDLRKSSKSLWKSSSSTVAQDNLNRIDGKIDLTKVKLKTLKKNNTDQVEKKVENEYTELLKKVMGDFKSGSSEAKGTPEMRCGQCENKAAIVSCQECNEDYCAKCFAQFHLKGALRRHHSLPLSASRNITRNAPQPMSEWNHEKPYSNYGINDRESVQTQSQGCQIRGRMTENNSFMVQTEIQDAGDCTSPHRSAQRESRSTSVERPTESPFPKIEFSSSLSYAERLLVHSNRRDPITAPSQNENISHRSSTCFDEDEEQIQSNMVWNTSTFEQLHRLATQSLNSSQLFDLCRLEDIEKSSECTSPSSDIQRVSVTEHVFADSARSPMLCGLDTIETNNKIQTAYLPTEADEDVLNTEESNRSTSRDLERNRVIWIRSESACQPGTTKADELTTVELIKRQLNQMAAGTQKEPHT